MQNATKDMALKADKSTKFPPKADIGNEMPDGAVPSPTPPPVTNNPPQSPSPGPGGPGGGNGGIVLPPVTTTTSRRGGPGIG